MAIRVFKTPSCVVSATLVKNRFFRFNGRLAVLSLFVLALSSFSFAANVAVGTCTKLAFYSGIQIAIDHVPAGSTIHICPGTYAEQLTIKKSLIIVGVSANGNAAATASGEYDPIIAAPSGGLAANATDLGDNSDIAAQIFVETPSGALQPTTVTMSNIAVDGSNNQIAGCGPDLVGIYYQNASGTLSHVAARNQQLTQDLFGCQSGLGIFVQSGYGSGGQAVVNINTSSVHGYQKNGITVDGSGTSATLTGNYVVGVGPTPLIAQNGIQVSDGATGKLTNNTVTDDVYINPDGGPYTSASGILLYDSGGAQFAPITISGNFVTNTQGGIVTFSDSFGTADFNQISGNRIMQTVAAGPFLIDGIDLCSNNNNSSGNTVFDSAGAGVHIDSECTDINGAQSGIGTSTKDTVNEACAGVLTGMNGGAAAQTVAFNVGAITASGDSCPSTTPKANAKGIKSKPRPQPKRF